MTLTFKECAEIDPAIAALEKLCRRAAPAANGDPDYKVFLLEVKPLVVTLVGWHRQPGQGSVMDEHRAYNVLGTEEAYDVVYQHLVDVIGGEA